MKQIFIGLAFGALATTAMANPAGLWKTEEGNSGGYAVVEIGACADDAAQLCGVIRDIVGNDDKSSVGKPIIKAMAVKSTNKWANGKIWAPDEDKWYDAKMELQGDILRVAGCVLGGIICRGQDWTPAN